MYDAASKHQKDASAPRMRKDENDVHKAMHTTESWVNPFKSRNATEPLVNIALHCREEGQCCLRQFCGEETKVKWNRLFVCSTAKSNLQTFGNLVKSRTVKPTATVVVVKADRGLFARMVVIAHHRQMNMQEVVTWTTAMVSSDSRWRTYKDSKIRTASHSRGKGPTSWICSCIRCMDTGWGGYIAFHERCTNDIQLSSQLCLPAREIGGVPGRTRPRLT